MKSQLFVLFLTVLSLSKLSAQMPPKITDEKRFGKDGYYLVRFPESNVIKGVLVLIPGYGEHPFAVTAQTSIVQEANKNGLAVLMANLSKDNADLAIDNQSMLRLSNMIKHFYERQKITAQKNLYLGGFSIGGTIAIRFFSQKNAEFKIKKIFAIDPPLDMVRLYKSLQKNNEKHLSELLEKLNPEQKLILKNLEELSVFNPDHTAQNTLPDYTQTALRIYCEPDILWWLENRNMDLYDINVIDCAAYINSLRQKSPENNVTLILSKDKGFRNGNQRHPHSWSIANPTELISWLLKN